MLASQTRFVFNKAQVLRSFSSVSYGKQKSKFNEELTVMRREWIAANLAKAEKEKAEKIAERKRTVLAMAVRLREKRKQSAVGQEAARKARVAAMDRYRENLARKQLLMEQKNALQQRRYQMALTALEEEKAAWVTLDNLDELVTADFFEKPATTGLVTKQSKLWRFQVYGTSLRRMEATGGLQEPIKGDPVDHFQRKAEIDKRLRVVKFLDQVVGTPEERVQYKELLEEFYDKLKPTGYFDDIDAEHSNKCFELTGRKWTLERDDEDNIAAKYYGGQKLPEELEAGDEEEDEEEGSRYQAEESELEGGEIDLDTLQEEDLVEDSGDYKAKIDTGAKKKKGKKTKGKR